MSYGPHPWQQAHWDWRAAGNFICGGAGSGLVAFAAMSGVRGNTLALVIVAGLALVGTGLVCVWLEIGRPWRALHVFFNPRTSWMSREAMLAAVLMALGLAGALGVHALVPLAALAGLGFVYCQGRILQASRGIPAWRSRFTTPLIVTSGLAEGGGLFWIATTWQAPTLTPLVAVFAALVLARALVWRAWRRRIAVSAAQRALAALDRPGLNLQWLGGAAPLALTALSVSGVAGDAASALLLSGAGLLVAGSGAAFKFTLVTRAAFNQGFSLTRLPVRGVPR